MRQVGNIIFSMVGPKKQEFWPKINILKGNHCTLWKVPKSYFLNEFSKSTQELSIIINILRAHFLLKLLFHNFNSVKASAIEFTKYSPLLHIKYVDFWSRIVLFIIQAAWYLINLKSRYSINQMCVTKKVGMYYFAVRLFSNHPRWKCKYTQFSLQTYFLTFWGILFLPAFVIFISHQIWVKTIHQNTTLWEGTFHSHSVTGTKEVEIVKNIVREKMKHNMKCWSQWQSTCSSTWFFSFHWWFYVSTLNTSPWKDSVMYQYFYRLWNQWQTCN